MEDKDLLNDINDLSYNFFDYLMGPHTVKNPTETPARKVLLAFEIPFDQLPLYVNDKDEIIRTVAQERLKAI